MWIRSVMLMFAMGCVGASARGDDPAIATFESKTINFHCLNHTSIHVVTCSGSISLFPITINIDSLRVLSDNELNILTDDLNDVTLIDGDVLDHNKILDDVETMVLDDFLDKFAITVTRAEILVCALVAGSQICK